MIKRSGNTDPAELQLHPARKSCAGDERVDISVGIWHAITDRGKSMAIRKSKDEAFEVRGAKEAVLKKCVTALQDSGFSSIRENTGISQIQADYHKFTTWGQVEITVMSVNADTSKVALHTTANVDNVFALFASPIDKIANAFKSAL